MMIRLVFRSHTRNKRPAVAKPICAIDTNDDESPMGEDEVWVMKVFVIVLVVKERKEEKC